MKGKPFNRRYSKLSAAFAEREAEPWNPATCSLPWLGISSHENGPRNLKQSGYCPPEALSISVRGGYEKIIMFRRFLTLLSVLSLALCIGTCVLWARSYKGEQAIDWNARWLEGCIIFSHGDIMLAWSKKQGCPLVVTGLWIERPLWSITFYDQRDLPPRNMREQYFGNTLYMNRFGIRFEKFESYFREFFLLLPCWFIALPAGVSPAIWMFRTLRRRVSVGTNHCTRCGYDLRASPDRCPECGTARKISS